jgi:hypothetical protein
VMAKLADGLYHQRRSAELPVGQLPRAAGVAAAEHLLAVAGPGEAGRRSGADAVRARGGADRGRWRAGGVLRGLRVASMDGSMAGRAGRHAAATRPATSPGTGRSAGPVGGGAESGTGSLLGAAIGRYADAEQPLAADLLGCFGPGMLVLADRKFVSWSAARAFLATGTHILWRALASFTLKPVRCCATAPTSRT